MRLIKLPFKIKKEILACGADLKGGFCFARGNKAYLVEGFGDLSQVDNLTRYEKTIKEIRRKYKLNPKIIACDMHPGYSSTKFAQNYHESRVTNHELRYIQHHHAHVAGCMFDNGIGPKAIGVSFDGTGFGTDGNMWGGEVLLAGFRKFERMFHLNYVPMPGGEIAIKEPERMAFSYLYKTYNGSLSGVKIPFLRRMDKAKSRVLSQMIGKGINSPLTSSAGRLFDGVSSLIGIRDKIKYEAEAAIELEKIADQTCRARYACRKWRTEDIIKAVVGDLKRKEEASLISAKFHNTIAYMIKDVVTKSSRATGLKRAVFSGGVFQNRYLVRRIKELFGGSKIEVYFHNGLSTTDSSIAVGQVLCV